MSIRLRLFAILSFTLYSIRCSFAILHNVTYDNLDPSVTYLPQGGDGWDVDIKEGLDYEGSHAVASGDPDASAVFQFTGNYSFQASARKSLIRDTTSLPTYRRSSVLFLSAVALQRFHCGIPRRWKQYYCKFDGYERYPRKRWFSPYSIFCSKIWIHWTVQ